MIKKTINYVWKEYKYFRIQKSTRKKIYKQHYTEQGNAEIISSKLWSRIRSPQAPFLFHVILNVSVAPATQEEEMKCVRIGKERDKLSRL